MQHVLVHIDSGLGPIGAWSYSENHLLHFYPDSLDVAISARAREAMAGRDPTISVPDWFHYLASHCNYLDEFETLEVHKPLTLPTILSEFRRAWKADAEPS